MLVQELYDKALAMIDSLTEDGNNVPEDENVDIEKKFLVFADMAQKEMWKYNKRTKNVTIVNKPPVNRLGLYSEFNIVDFEGETQFVPDEDGLDNVQGYSIKLTEAANDNAVISFQEKVAGVWTDLVVLNPTGLTELTVFKGVLNVSSTDNPVRIKVEGSEHFRHKDRALWQYKYKADKVPTSEAWVKVDMPDDFNTVDMVVEEFPVAKYDNVATYKLENYRDFYYSFAYEGEIRIIYKPIPTTITALTDTIEIDDILAQNIVYDVVGKLGFYENKDLVNYAEQRRVEGKSEASTDDPLSVEVMTDYYGGGGSY